MYSHPDDIRRVTEMSARERRLLEAYAARRQVLTDANRDYLLEQREPDLADLMATHSIHVSPYDAIVYARIDTREVGVKYSAVGGDKAEAVRLAVREVLRLVGVTQ